MSTCLLTYCDNRLDSRMAVCYYRRAVSNSPVAQLVEQLTVNKQAPTNSPSPSRNDLHARKLSLFLSENNGQLAPSRAIIDNKPLLSYRPLKTRRNSSGGLGPCYRGTAIGGNDPPDGCAYTQGVVNRYVIIYPKPLPAPSHLTTKTRRRHPGGLGARFQPLSAPSLKNLWHCALLLQCGQGGSPVLVRLPSCLKSSQTPVVAPHAAAGTSPKEAV